MVIHFVMDVLEALSRKKECPCCRTEIFDLHKNKKRMSLTKATELAKVNLSYLFRNNYKDLIENSIFNIFEESLNFKCSCELVNCSNNKIHFEQDEINETLKNIQKLKEKVYLGTNYGSLSKTCAYIIQLIKI